MMKHWTGSIARTLALLLGCYRVETSNTYNQNGLISSFNCTDSSRYEILAAKDFGHLFPHGRHC